MHEGYGKADCVCVCSRCTCLTVTMPLKRYLFVSYKHQKTATIKLYCSQPVNSDLFAISDQPLFLHMRSKIQVSIKHNYRY